MGNRTVSTISIALDAQTAALKKGFAEGRQEISKLSDGLSGKVAAGMAKFHLALAAVQAAVNALKASLAALFAKMAEIDLVEKFAARIGTSGDQLRILDYAAGQTGASVETMHMALQRMTRRVSEAANGTGEAVAALQELGLSATHLESLSPDQQFAAIADAMQNVSGQSDKVRLAMKLFDSEGVALVNTLALGSKGLNEMADKAEKLGFLLGDGGVEVQAANDAIDNMKKAWGGIVQQVATDLAPTLRVLADVLTEVLKIMRAIYNHTVGPLIKGFGAVADFLERKIGPAWQKLFGCDNPAETVFGGATKAIQKAATAVAPVARVVQEVTERVQTAAEKAQAIVDQVKKEHLEKYGAFQATPGVAAVTRGTQAGFSAVQEAYRQRRDEERRHAMHMDLLRKIYHALSREGLSLVGVDI